MGYDLQPELTRRLPAELAKPRHLVHLPCIERDEDLMVDLQPRPKLLKQLFISLR
ncbi:hypothetical protein Cch01nite_40470 [Cellulomonas chitinilytica]|uniref:Uncharacterized protein n=1 Tax=Cellulomonas chitinilytica TaxID=398759 RepID=A0A919P7B2_9CELL|nr:hypothetical protein Cch01nite_40470 [Cellulomonas chitinilytica]